MTVLTDKELIKEIKERIGSLDVRDNIERRAYEIALASLEAEPVGEFYEYKPGDWYQRSVGDKAPKWVPLYATPPVRELQADVAQAIENLKQKLVECNRYNYCADAVKNVEDACRAVSYSQADNQPASGNQAAESNRGNEWTGNPDIDNAIIMLDRIDTLENCDDDRIEAVKAVLRRLAGNSPVTPDSWISCSERMPAQDDWILIYSKHGEYMAGQVQGEYVELSDGTLSWLGNALFWMPLPEPPQEVNQ
ncbi:DUF551 domain-containing protein [Salmonella enterica]|nr:DUF551 domain-containing protein [Salmonella enterica]WGN78778.1 DUF551 domain-containing protein [Salmonella enterica subsp. enterica serovar 4,[5],12:i:-]